MSMFRTAGRWPYFAATVLWASSPSWAGPSTSDAQDQPSVSAPVEPTVPDRLRTPEAQAGSRTVDLLIDLQQRNAGLQFNERSSPNAGTALRVRPQVPPTEATTRPQEQPAPRQDGATAAPSGLFGTGSTPQVQTQRSTRAESPAAASTDARPPRRAEGSSGAESLPAWMMLPREVVEYVRENRGFVLGSATFGLLLVWGLSMLFSRAGSAAGSHSGAEQHGGAGISADRWARPPRQSHQDQSRSHRRHP